MEGMYSQQPTSPSREALHITVVYCRHCKEQITVRQTRDGKNVIGLHRCRRAPDLYGKVLEQSDKKIAEMEAELQVLREKKLHRFRGQGANYKVGLNTEHYALLWYMVHNGVVSEKSAVPMRELVRILNKADQRKRNGKHWEANASTSGRLSEIVPYGYIKMIQKRVAFVKDQDDFSWRYEYQSDNNPNKPRKWRSKPLWYVTPEGCKEIRLKFDAGKQGREKEVAKAVLPPDEKRDVA